MIQNNIILFWRESIKNIHTDHSIIGKKNYINRDLERRSGGENVGGGGSRFNSC
jgi:hypothetical protein